MSAIDTLQRSALLGQSCTSHSRDADTGREWIWAGVAGETVPGDGTRECDQLVVLGLLAPREVDDGYYVYELTEAGIAARNEIRSGR